MAWMDPLTANLLDLLLELRQVRFLCDYAAGHEQAHADKGHLFQFGHSVTPLG